MKKALILLESILVICFFPTVPYESNSGLLFKTWCLHYPQCYLASDITGANMSDDMHLPLEPRKALNYFFFSHMQYYSPVNL